MEVDIGLTYNEDGAASGNESASSVRSDEEESELDTYFNQIDNRVLEGDVIAPFLTSCFTKHLLYQTSFQAHLVGRGGAAAMTAHGMTP